MLIIQQFTGNEEKILAFNFAVNQSKYIYAKTFCKQVGILCSYLINNAIDVSFARIGEIFGKTRGIIYDQYKNYIRRDTNNGKCSVGVHHEP